MRRVRGHLGSCMPVLLAALVLADAAAAERCAWSGRNDRDLHLTLGALLDADHAPGLRL